MEVLFFDERQIHPGKKKGRTNDGTAFFVVFSRLLSQRILTHTHSE